ncbi:hypothetical protein [Candidatus Poriferisodalis sp.]|uniref:hypothetical protein n=1 Tax=Candidatus Poriferisodalis sp. TaxID=3101277 RepID=UPI003AF5F6DA
MTQTTTLTNHNPPATHRRSLNPTPTRREESETPQFQTQRLTGPLAKAAPKRLRWQLWHLPALVCETGRRVKLRLPTAHPGAKALLAAQHPN